MKIGIESYGRDKPKKNERLNKRAKQKNQETQSQLNYTRTSLRKLRQTIQRKVRDFLKGKTVSQIKQIQKKLINDKLLAPTYKNRRGLVKSSIDGDAGRMTRTALYKYFKNKENPQTTTTQKTNTKKNTPKPSSKKRAKITPATKKRRSMGGGGLAAENSPSHVYQNPSTDHTHSQPFGFLNVLSVFGNKTDRSTKITNAEKIEQQTRVNQSIPQIESVRNTPRSNTILSNIGGVNLIGYAPTYKGRKRYDKRLKLNVGTGYEVNQHHYKNLLRKTMKTNSQYQWQLADITDSSPKTIAESGNPNKKFMPASTMKPITISGYFGLKGGRMTDVGYGGKKLAEIAADALSVSDNTAWSHFRKGVPGGKQGRKGHAIIKDYFQGKYYSSDNNGYGIRTTPAQSVQFLSDLYHERVPKSKEILNIMYGCQQTRVMKFFPNGVPVATKSGSIPKYNTTSEISTFEMGGRQYALTIFMNGGHKTTRNNDIAILAGGIANDLQKGKHILHANVRNAGGRVYV